MKRIFGVALVVLVALALMVGSAFADTALGRFSNNQNVKMYVAENSSGTTLQNTAVSVATIIPYTHRILGYTVAPYNAASVENWVVLADTTAVTGISTTYVFSESEAATGSSNTVIYPYPKTLTNGLFIRQGPRTVVTVYYEDTREI